MKSILLLVSWIFLFKVDGARAVDECCGKCTGSAYCTACRNCSRCAHCNSGGSCGVCSNDLPTYKPSRSVRYPSSSPSSTIKPSRPSSLKLTTVQYYVNTSLLNVRSGPGTSFPVITKVSVSTNVKIENEFNNGWCEISFINTNYLQVKGYVVKKYLAYYTKAID
ncbi:SH3 domain-containing protein [Chitinophaga horti]|uniref:SH3 domain-containing protein n=1 Tax=Chitinophaga horti TaxID=2920382 RepID=UPI003D818F34